MSATASVTMGSQKNKSWNCFQGCIVLLSSQHCLLCHSRQFRGRTLLAGFCCCCSCCKSLCHCLGTSASQGLFNVGCQLCKWQSGQPRNLRPCHSYDSLYLLFVIDRLLNCLCTCSSILWFALPSLATPAGVREREREREIEGVREKEGALISIGKADMDSYYGLHATL
jgi:hypothetical protein